MKNYLMLEESVYLDSSRQIMILHLMEHLEYTLHFLNLTILGNYKIELKTAE